MTWVRQQWRTERGRTAVLVIAFCTILAGSCRSVPHPGPAGQPTPPETIATPAPGSPTATPSGPPAVPIAAGPLGPPVRIGIVVDAGRASIGADSGVTVETSTGRRFAGITISFAPVRY